MKVIFKPDLKAHVSVDNENKVRHLRHSQEYWLSEDNIPRVSAETYLVKWAETLQIPQEQLQNLNKKVSFYEPREQGVEYQLSEEKHMFDSTTVAYYQTYLNTPVWRRGLSINIKQNPNRVLSSTINSEDNLEGSLPNKTKIDRYKNIFRQVTAQKAALDAGLGETEWKDEPGELLREIMDVTEPSSAEQVNNRVPHFLRGKFFIYKYDPNKRYAGKPLPPNKNGIGEAGEEGEMPLLEIPPVDDSIKTGKAYLVAEIIFQYGAPSQPELVWLMLVEIETDSILYIECMTCGVSGLVFKRDPIVSSGDLTITANRPNEVLDDYDFKESLNDLDAPVGGNQSLSGTYVFIQDREVPNVPPPTQAIGSDFDYAPRTNEFAAVSAYYHLTQLFRTIADLGFIVEDYFDGTTFPISVDHRSNLGTSDGVEINAFWSPNGTSGTGRLGYCLCDLSDTRNPLGRAVDPWVHWHEMGGHGVLGDHLDNSGKLEFAHSHGDGLAAIQMDPESSLRAGPERFRYAPFRPFTLERRFDRDVSSWAWGSEVVQSGSRLISGDDGDYGSEQILATCHFRIYRSIGGDSDDVNYRKFASRIATYLILRTTASMFSGTNPSNPEAWCEMMQTMDKENWTTEGLSGGAYNKVIRWAFERQGAYQPAGAPMPVTTPGAPPEVDVYIDDGRAGEYQFQAVHWHNTSMWNRNAPDGMAMTIHENAIEDRTNYMYGKVKNRGTLTANNVTVRAFHSLPGAGLVWPNDFVEMNPVGGLPIASIPANNASEVMVGPFEWEPNINAYGHDCVLMIASVAGDTSNIDQFTATETIQEWRLVPHDNNIGQRNIIAVPGAGGAEALTTSLDGAFFMAGNNLNKRATMELRVELPKVLAEKGWQLQFDGISDNKFLLKAGEKRKIQLILKRGLDFTKADIEGLGDRMINVKLFANGILLGGMSYYVDPDLEKPSGGKQPSGKDCGDAAQKLLDCLTISGERKVKKVCVKKVSLDIELDNDCGCD
jgi:hypothetical protein